MLTFRKLFSSHLQKWCHQQFWKPKLKTFSKYQHTFLYFCFHLLFWCQISKQKLFYKSPLHNSSDKGLKFFSCFFVLIYFQQWLNKIKVNNTTSHTTWSPMIFYECIYINSKKLLDAKSGN